MPVDFTVTDWETLEPYFKKNLLEREFQTKEDLEQWLRDQSELEAMVNEDACWRQIKMTCDTENKALEEAFNYFFTEIQPKIQPYADALNKSWSIIRLPGNLTPVKYHTYLRNIRKNIELFRKKTFLYRQNLL